MMVHCVVLKCPSRHGKSVHGHKISFHRFPMSKKLRMEWENRIRSTNMTSSDQSIATGAKLCSLHFKEDCYSVSRTTAASMGHSFTRWKLKDDAVPTLFVKESCDDENKEKNSLNDIPTKGNQSNLTFHESESQSIPKIDGRYPSDTLQCLNIDGKELTSKRKTDDDHHINSKSPKWDPQVIVKKASECLNEPSSSNVPSIEKDKISDVMVMVESDCLEKDEKPDLTDTKDTKNDSVSINSKFNCGSSILCRKCGDNFPIEEDLSDHVLSCCSVEIKDLTNNTDTGCDSVVTSGSKEQPNKRVYRVVKVCISDYDKQSGSIFLICGCGFIAQSSEQFLAHSSAHMSQKVFTCMFCLAELESFLLLQQHVHKEQHYWAIRCTPSAVSKPPQKSLSSSNSQLVKNNEVSSKTVIDIPKPVVSKSLASSPGNHFNFGKPVINSSSINVSLDPKVLRYGDYNYSDSKVGAMDLTINGLKHVGGAIKCGLCSFSSSSARDLLSHRKSHENVSSVPVENKNLKVCLGLKNDESKSAANRVMLKCDICVVFYTTSAIELLKHKATHDETDVPFRCKNCSYVSRSAKDMLKHKKDQLCSDKSVIVTNDCQSS